MKVKYHSLENIVNLESNEVFVFGSNLAGIHGRGAAEVAHKKFSFPMRKGEGLWGKCYALPTKNHNIKTLSLSEIRTYIENFNECVELNPSLEFIMTRIGCGLAGYTDEQIASLFKLRELKENVIYPERWKIIFQQKRQYAEISLSSQIEDAETSLSVLKTLSLVYTSNKEKKEKAEEDIQSLKDKYKTLPIV